MTNKEYAKYYLSRGLCVLPACSPDVPGHNLENCGRALGKHPLLKEWTSYQKKKPTPQEIESWWEEWPDANLFIVAGEVSGNLVVIDIDDAEEYATWAEATNFNVDLTSTWNYKTGSGGLHAHFRTDFPARKRKFGWGEIQGEGTYVIVPPSLHQNGEYYSPALTDKDKIAMAPPPLLATLSSPGKGSDARDRREYVRELVEGLKSLSKGERVNKLVAYGGRLIEHGISPDEVEFLLGTVNSLSEEPLTDEEFDSMVAPAARRFGQKKLEELRKLQLAKEATQEDEVADADKLPKFPKEVMKGVLGEVVAEYDKIREGASEFYFCAVAQQFLTASGRTIQFENSEGGTLDRKPKFFMVIAAPTGHHKSTAVMDIKQLMNNVVKGSYVCEAGARGSGEGLNNKLKERKTMIVFYDEFKILLQKKKQEANTLVNELTRLFEETTIEGMTVKDTAEVTDVFLNLTGLVTIKDLKRVITSDLDEGGFLNRIFFVVGRDREVRPDKIQLDKDVKARIVNRLGDVLRKYGTELDLRNETLRATTAAVQYDSDGKATGQPELGGETFKEAGVVERGVRTLSRSAEAQEVFETWYRRMRKTDEDRSYAVRLDNYFYAWEVALTMSNLEDVVTQETALSVVKIMDYELAIRKWIWSHIQEGSYNEWAGRVTEKVREEPGATKGRLRYVLHGDRNPTAFASGMDAALRAGMIERVVDDKGVEVYILGGIE